jgi:hypothetical protein
MIAYQLGENGLNFQHLRKLCTTTVKNIQKGVFWAIWPKSKRLAPVKWLSGSQLAS